MPRVILARPPRWCPFFSDSQTSSGAVCSFWIPLDQLLLDVIHALPLRLAGGLIVGFGRDVGCTHSNWVGWGLEQCGGTTKERVLCFLPTVHVDP